MDRKLRAARHGELYLSRKKKECLRREVAEKAREAKCVVSDISWHGVLLTCAYFKNVTSNRKGVVLYDNVCTASGAGGVIGASAPRVRVSARKPAVSIMITLNLHSARQRLDSRDVCLDLSPSPMTFFTARHPPVDQDLYMGHHHFAKVYQL